MDNEFPQGEAITDQTPDNQPRPFKPINQPSQMPENQPEQAQISLLDQIDKDELGQYIIRKLREDISDKEELDWKSRRTYEINAYYGIKPKVQYPWHNASNFPVPLTPTLVDTAHSNILGSIFSDPQDTIQVDGVGPEDKKKAQNLESLLNWQMYEEINGYPVMDKVVFRSLTSPGGVVKVIQSVFEKKLLLESISSDDIFVPLDAKGFQVNQTDHVFQVVALNDNDMEERKRLKVYENLDNVPKGSAIRAGTLADVVTQAKDVAFGTNMDRKNKRDAYYIMECYLTYYWKPSDAPEDEAKQPIELQVWIAPNGGQVLRVVENKTKKRPFVAFIPYPSDDRFWGRSLPEVIRFIQEELDYAHNQNINAADVAILPPMFYREGSDFDPEANKRVPGGAYPVPDPADITFQPVQVNPIFERQEDRYWDLAERLTGLTELFQGRQPPGKQTATLTIRRENRSEIRFKTLYQRYETSFSELVDLIYFFDKLYFPKDKVVKVIGVTEQFKTVDQLFPEGMEGNYNFKFSNAPLTEKEAKKNETLQLYEILNPSPIIQGNIANMWRMDKKLAEALGEKNLESLVNKPREANIATPEECIQRIMSGETDFMPDPGIDAENYMLRLNIFFKTDTFKMAESKIKAAFILLFLRIKAIRQGQIQMLMDHKQVMGGNAGNPGQGGQSPIPGGGQDGQPQPGQNGKGQAMPQSIGK